jgi:hypothetical protein
VHVIHPSWTTAIAGVLLTATITACGGGDSASVMQAADSQPSTSVPTPEPATTTEAPEPVATTAAPVAPAAEPTVDFVMPNFTGVNLQDAQNKVQELGVFFSVSHDLRGSRNQVIDSNWQVCDQTPAAGKRIKGKAADYEGKIDFGVVKLTEACP